MNKPFRGFPLDQYNKKKVNEGLLPNRRERENRQISTGANPIANFGPRFEANCVDALRLGGK